MLDRHAHRRFSVVGRPPCEHLVHDHAQGVDIRTVIHPGASGLLGRDVMDGAQGLLGQRVLGGGDAGDAEIGDLDAAVLEDHHVMGLDVPVDDAAAVGVLQRLGDLHGKMQRFPPGKGGALIHILLQRDPVDQLHHDIVQIVVFGHVVDADDVGMGQHGNRLGLAVKTAAEIRVVEVIVL